MMWPIVISFLCVLVALGAGWASHFSAMSTPELLVAAAAVMLAESLNPAHHHGQADHDRHLGHAHTYEPDSQLKSAAPIIGFASVFAVDVIARAATTSVAGPNAIAATNLAADFIHNVADGLGLAAAFDGSVGGSFATGMAVSSGVIAHEIAQEIADVVYLHSCCGWQKRKVAFWNGLVAVGAPIGVLLYSSPSHSILGEESGIPWFDVARGSFIYMGACQLIPEAMKALQEKVKVDKYMSVRFLVAFVTGVAVSVFIHAATL